MTVLQAESGTLDGMQIRKAMAAIPTSVSVVAGDLIEAPVAIVVGSFVSISLNPPLVGFLVGLESTSWPKLRECSRLGISVLSEEQDAFVREITKKEAGRFEAGKWKTGPRGEMLVRSAVTHMTGSVCSVTRVGDHDFIVIELETIESDWENAPLVFHAQRLTTVHA